MNTASWDKMNIPGNWDLVNEYSEFAGDAWYYLKYQQGDFSFVSEKTINAFIEIENEQLNPEKPIQFQLIAVNNVGESDPSKNQTIELNKSELYLLFWM